MSNFDIVPRRYKLRDPDPESGVVELESKLLQQGLEYNPNAECVWVEISDVKRGDKCDPRWKVSFKYADQLTGKWIYVDFCDGYIWLRRYVRSFVPQSDLTIMVKSGYLLPVDLLDGPEKDLNLREKPIIWKL